MQPVQNLHMDKTLLMLVLSWKYNSNTIGSSIGNGILSVDASSNANDNNNSNTDDD